MKLAPGSVLWLLKHEMRVAWRGMSRPVVAGKPKSRRPLISWIIVGSILTLFTFTAGVPLGFYLRTRYYGPPAPALSVMLDFALAVVATLMLAQTLAATTVAFYERGDLDLILSSPISPRKLLAVRALAIATNASLLMTLLVSPFVIPAAILGHWPWLAVYPIIASTALMMTVAGISLAMALFAVLGPRRTRTVAQVMAAVIGASFFLASQASNMFGNGTVRSGRLAMLQWVEHRLPDGIPATSILSWPAQAVMGAPLPFLAYVAIAITLFVLTARSLGDRFAVNAAAAAGAGAGGRKRPARAGPEQGLSAFSSGPFPALIKKELRLLSRDIALISQVLMQTLYVIPLVFLMIRGAGSNSQFQTAALAAAVVFLAGRLAGGLGWITISAEEAPDLLACAPATALQMRQGKVAAVLIPVIAVLAIPVLVLAWFSPWAALVVLVGAGATATFTAFIELWRQRPGKRSNFRRRAQDSFLVNLVEMLMGMFFAAAALLAVAFGGTVWIATALIPAAIAVGIAYTQRPGPAERANPLLEA